MRRLIIRRVIAMVFQALGIVVAVFILVRVIPGNPAYRLAGPLATPEQIARIESQLGIDKPLHEQFFAYITGLTQGDFGTSVYTQQPVREDLIARLPATFELITIALLLSLLLSIPAGVAIARRPGGWVDRVTRGYSLFAGSQPEFWWALMFLYVFFVVLNVAPGPTGRLPLTVAEPEAFTGLYTIDTLIAGDFAGFQAAVKQLLLPVATAVLVYSGPIMKMTRESVGHALQADFVSVMRAMGVSEWRVTRAAFRNALPAVVTTAGVTYVFLLSGAVLIETVFGWNGIGRYAVQGARNGDYPAIQGVVLLAALFAVAVYFIVDVIQSMLDPRVRH